MKKLIALLLSVTLLAAMVPVFTLMGEDEPLWRQLEGGSQETKIQEIGDGVYSAEQDDWSRIITTQAYDVREKEISFKAASSEKNAWYTIGIAGENGEIGSFGSADNRIDIVMHFRNGEDFAYTFENNAVTTFYGSHGCGDFTESHTFGFANKGVNWFLTIDGEILNDRLVDSALNDLLNNNRKVYFIIGAWADYKFTDIKLTDNERYVPWVASSGEAEILENEDGTYKLSGSAEITSNELYNTEDYELSFESGESLGKGLRIGVSIPTDDGGIIQKGLYLQIGEGDCEIGWFGNEEYVPGLKTTALSASKKHTFGIKKRGDIFYPVIDGNTVFFPDGDEWQTRLTEFSNFVEQNSGILGFTFFSENGLSLDNVEVTLGEPDWVQHKGYGEGSNIEITKKSDGYSLSAKGAVSFLTADIYDLSANSLCFRFTGRPENGWIHLSVASDATVEQIGGVLHEEAAPTRVDFLIYQSNNAFCQQSTNPSVGESMYIYDGTVNCNNITHTFGITKQGDNWYPVIDGVVKNNAVSPYLNEFMSKNDVTKLRLGIGASGDFALENVKTVSNKTVWQAEGYGDSTAANTSDTTAELYYDGGPAKYKTVDSYDVTKKEFTFKAPEMGDDFIFVGLNNGTKDQGLFIRVSNASKPIGLITTDNENWVTVLDGLDYRTLSPSENHSFSVREKDGKYYPAIDGRIVTGDSSNESVRKAMEDFDRFVKENGGQFKFIIRHYSGKRFAIENVAIINSNLLWEANSGSNLMVSVDENGVYSAAGISRISTVKKYDLTQYDVSLKLKSSDKGGWLYFAISESGAANDAILTSSANAESTERMELIAALNGDFVSLVNANYNDTSVHSGFYGLSKDLIDFSIPHTYGVRRLNGHWYFAVDGRILNSDVISERLDDFMTTKGTTEFYITIGMGGSEYTAEDIKLVAREDYGDWVVKSGGGVIEKASDGTYSVTDYKGSIITNNTYDITQNDIAFNITGSDGDYIDFIRMGLAAADESVSENIASKEIIARVGGKMYISYFLGDTEDAITARKYDFNVRHTFGVRQLDGHWYPAVDGAILNYKYNDAFDEFIEANKANGIRFILGSQVAFSVTGIEVIPQVDSSVKEPEGWDYFGSNGTADIYGELDGNENDGYSMEVPKGYSFAISNAKYNLSESSLRFTVEDLGEFLYFGISNQDAFLRPNVLPDKDSTQKDIISAFILRPTDSHNKVIVSYWSPEYDGIESAIKTVPIDWYSEHTLDIRKVGNNWFVCLDGAIIQSRISPRLNKYMQENEGNPLHYVIGSLTVGLTLHNIKVIDQVPLATNKDQVYEDGTLDDDYGFDFSGDSNYFDDLDDFGEFDFGDDFSDSEYEYEETDDGEIEETANTRTARVRKRRLVSAGHGWIFTKLEIAAMIAGGVLVLAGVTVAVVVVVRNVKKKKKIKQAQ